MFKESTHAWLPPALSLLLVGWGANQFASMLSVYENSFSLSRFAVTSALGIYILGLVPALLLGGPLSDKLGRKRASVSALTLAMLASFIIIGAIWITPLLFVGRTLAGAATGIALAATTSWVAELSHDSVRGSTLSDMGTKRAATYTTLGFLFGPVVSGGMASVVSSPEILPYVFHILLCLPLIGVLCLIPETVASRHRAIIHAHAANELWAYSSARSRFLTVVLPAAPWIFGSASIGFAVVPELLPLAGEAMIIYSTAAVVLTLGSGVLTQSLARRAHSLRSARSSLMAISFSVSGLALSILTAGLQDPWLGLITACFLGAGYGLVLASGLLEVRRLAVPRRLGSAIGIFYAIGYAGFLLPAVIAGLQLWITVGEVLISIFCLAVISLLIVFFNSRKHLPH